MTNVKLLISSLPAIGKTTLLKDLKDVLVIARDGKKYPFPQPHVNVEDFTSVDELIELIVNKVNLYEEKMGELPKTIVFDSISKILLDIEGYVCQQVNSFPYAKVNTEIKKLVDFIESGLVSQFNVVLVSHAQYDEDTSSYKLVNAGGAFSKKGGVLSEVDEAVFIEMKGKKRILHYRNPRLVSRTTSNELPDTEELTDKFNLQKHLEHLMTKQSKAEEWSL